jgi:hypothetical protein
MVRKVATRQSGWLLALILGTVILAGLVLTDALPWLRGPAPETSEWYWPYLLRPINQWWAAGGAALLLVLVAGWWLQLRPEKRWLTPTAVFLLICTSLLLQWGLVYAHKTAVFPELIDRTLSHQASGFFQTAANIENMNELLAAFPAAMPTFGSDHARTHPPGLILANWLTIRLFDHLPRLAEAIAPSVWAARCTDLWLFGKSAAVAAALAVWAVLPLLAAASTVWPAYLLAKQLLPYPAAKLAAILAATLPSLLLFTPKSVQLFAPLTLFLLWAFHLALQNWSRRWFLLAGLLYAFATFLSLGNFALLLLLLIYALLTIWQQKAWQQVGWRRIVAGGLLFGGAGLSIWLVYWLIWGVAPWLIWQTGLAQHYELATSLRRYDWWLLWNLVDVVVYAGLPVAVGYGAGVVVALKNGRSHHLHAINNLALSLLVLLIFLNLSGSARGEVGRIWLFFLPLLALVAAGFWHDNFSGWKTAVLLISLQLLLTVSVGVAWQPVRAVIVVAQEPVLDTTRQPETATQIAFQESGGRPATLTLEGHTIRQHNDTIDVDLFWRGDRHAKRPFTVFVQLLDSNGQLVTQQDNWPVNGQWPPTCWPPDTLVIDSYQLRIPPDTTPGMFTLITGFYDASTGERLLTTIGTDFVLLDSFTWP